jgi:hypothetical protein
MPRIEIDLRCGIGTILVDGSPVRGVTSIEISGKPGKPATVKLEMLALELLFRDTEANVEETTQAPPK